MNFDDAQSVTANIIQYNDDKVLETKMKILSHLFLILLNCGDNGGENGVDDGGEDGGDMVVMMVVRMVLRMW